jgi:hypothetical protein
VHLYKYKYVNGEGKCPNFVEWLEDNYNNFLEVHGLTVAERYSRHDFIESVHLVNMHDVKGGLIESFFCSNLRAESTCLAIQNGAKPSYSNIGTNHEYHRIAIEAKLAGKIPDKYVTKKKPMSNTAKTLEKRVKESNITLPMLCPTKEMLNNILNQELETERKYFLEWHESQGGEEALRESFEKAAEKKFCCYDVVEILNSGILDVIFREFT